MASRNKIKAELQKASVQSFENLMDEINGKGKKAPQKPKFRDETKSHKKTQGNKKNGYKSAGAKVPVQTENSTKPDSKEKKCYFNKEEDKNPRPVFKPQRIESRKPEQKVQKSMPSNERKAYPSTQKNDVEGYHRNPNKVASDHARKFNNEEKHKPSTTKELNQQMKDFQRGTSTPPVKKGVVDQKPAYGSKDVHKAKEQTTKTPGKPKRPSLAFITQTEDGHATLKPVLTSKRIPCVWDYKSKERIRIVAKADGSLKSAIYIPKADANVSTIPEGGNALIGIVKSNIIVDYLPLIDKVIIYKVNDISTKDGEIDLIQLAVYNTCTKGKWGRKPFESIERLYHVIKNAYTDPNWKGYYDTYIQDKTTEEKK